jgi:hypothetical protein
MRKTKAIAVALTAAVLGALALAPAASAAFGLKAFDAAFTDANGEPERRAGAHPFAADTYLEFNYGPQEEGKLLPEGGDIKTTTLELLKGLAGSAVAAPPCSTLDFLGDAGTPKCAVSSIVGITAVRLNTPESEPVIANVHNLVAPPGVAARLGFQVLQIPVTIDVSVKQSPDHNIVARIPNAAQAATVFAAATQIWGVPADPRHDFARGSCRLQAFVPGEPRIVDGKLNLKRGAEAEAAPQCPAGTGEVPLLTLPRACQGPLATGYEIESWLGNREAGAQLTPAFTGCDASSLPFDPGISSQATADSAEAASGLDFEIEFIDEVDPGNDGLSDPDGIVQSDIKKTVVTLPRGVTVNPSIAEGLDVCTLADLDRETIGSAPGKGCPNGSKIGTVSVETPLIDQLIEGSVFLAEQDEPATAAEENPFDSLIAFYIVLKHPGLGVLVKVPAEVSPDPATGQLVTTVDDIPQVPFSRFRFHFREGQRAPLVTPPVCGAHTTRVEFSPWARPDEVVTRTAELQITRGVGGGPCPPGGVPPFEPGFQAGSLNNSAATFSPFLMRLTRADGEQDMTRFSATLPPGVLGKLAGVDKCPEAQIALARSKGGRAELRSPSCPANSRIGGTLGGAGVGSSLTYVPGSIYLAGPHRGAPLSVVAITPAVAGPFDAGTVVVRVALTVNPVTADVEVDGERSDPIPHILKGIPLKVRDLRVDVDRPGFTTTPTSCEESDTRATLFGAFLDLFSPADDVPVALRSRYQAANCSRLAFGPRIGLRLRGGTRRGANPSLVAVLRPRAGEANIERTVVRLPQSAFLDQAHIRTICTRVQFAADRCPKGAIYGRVAAFSPLLDEPLRGPAYLRSSSNQLPDLVFDLRGVVDIETSARIDSIRGGIRATFNRIPDAPLSRVVVRMQGGKKGLIVNSRNLCRGKSRANVRLDAHNGKRRVLRPVLRAQCKRGEARRRSRHRGVG